MQEGVGTAAEVRGSRSDPAAGLIIVAEPGDVVLHQHAPRVHVDLQNLQLMIVADEGSQSTVRVVSAVDAEMVVHGAPMADAKWIRNADAAAGPLAALDHVRRGSTTSCTRD